MIVGRHFPANAEFLIPLAAHSRRDSICWGGKKAFLPYMMICD